MTDSNQPGTRVTELLKLAQSDPLHLQELEQFRRTLVVMFSDIQGSTAYFEKYGDAAGLLMVHRCNDTIRGLVEKHGGRVIKTIGDGTMATFPEPTSALEAAIEIQTALAELSASAAEEQRVALRIGMHYGAGIVRTNDVFGDVVNTASRVESVAKAGQIVISEEFYDQVRSSNFTIRELGRFKLKGKTGERTLFQTIWNQSHGAPTDFGVHSPDLPPAPSQFFRLQLVRKDGAASSPEYPVPSELAIELSNEGTLSLSQNFHSPSLCARVFVEDHALFVEERSTVGAGIFLRLAGAYVLEHQDIFLAGRQVFRYDEMPDQSSSATAIIDPRPADPSAADTAALVAIDSRGNPAGRYPLNAPEVKIGRTYGAYVFPDDNLMSRAHLRISQRGEDFVLEDLGSRNGTFVKVRGKTPLSAGSVLLIAGQSLRVIN